MRWDRIIGAICLGLAALSASIVQATGGTDFANQRRQALARIQQAPNDAAGFVDLAGWLFRDGDLRRAVAAAEEAARLEPNSANHQRLVGYLLAATGAEERAESAFRRAAALDAAGRAWLADFHLAQAWAEYQDALRRGRPDPVLEERIRALAAVVEISPDLKVLMNAVPVRSAAASAVPPIFLGHDVQNAIVVEKRTQTVRLYGRDGDDLALLQTYPCTTGQEPGAKQRRGDRRTPDGVYVVSDLLHGDGLPDRYGALAMPLSYPNAWDRLVRRSGYGIWFHGSDRLGSPFTRRDTEGCIILRNEDLVDLARVVTPGVTPVLIAEEVPYQPMAEWKATVQAVLHDVPVTQVLAVVADPQYTVVMHRDGTSLVRDFVQDRDGWRIVTSDRTPAIATTEWDEKVASLAPASPVALLNVRVLDDEQPARVVVETSAPVQARSYQAELGDQLYLDLPGVLAAPLPTRVRGHGLFVKSVRVAPMQIDPPVTRLVINLQERMQYRIASEGNRTIVSLAAATP